MLRDESSDSVRGLATAGKNHTTAVADAPAGSSDDDSALALSLLGEDAP